MLRTAEMKILKTGALRGVPVFVFGLSAILFGAALVGCDRIIPPPSVPTNFAAPSPGRDELYVSGSHRLSMSAYEGLRREFPGLTATDAAQFALATQWFATAEKVTMKDAAQCVRTLFSPAMDSPTLERTASRLKSSFGIESVAALRERWSSTLARSAIEWNIPLAKDYGIDTASLGRNSR